MKFCKRAPVTTIASLLVLSSVCDAAPLFAYPPSSRTEAQQRQDRFECHEWAVEQSKFDPVEFAAQTAAAPAPQGQSSQTQGPAGTANIAGRAAVGGAARGAVVGEVANGDAGKGAAAGATLGLVRGRLAERKIAEERAAAQAQAEQRAKQEQGKQAEQLQTKREAYQRARGICFKGRGYTVGES